MRLFWLKILVFVLSFLLFNIARHRVIPIDAVGIDREDFFTGDEPQYCLMAHSFVFDGDFKIKNNVQRKDYRAFYSKREMTGHSWGTKGELFSEHRIGLPILIAIPYYFGYLTGFGERFLVCEFINLIGAFLALNVFLLVYELTQDKIASGLSWVAVCFSMPILIYSSYMIYPDLPAALLVIFALRRLLKYEKPSIINTLLISLCAAYLPWLNEKFFIATLVLIAFFLWKSFYKPWELTFFFVPIIISGVFQAIYYYALYGNIFPGFGHYAEKLDHFEFLGGFSKGMPGLLLDRDFGLFIYSPIYLIILLGFLLMFRYRKEALFWTILLFISIYVVVGFYAGWWWATSPPPRYIVAAIPLLAIPIGFSFAMIRRRSFRILFSVLLLISLLTGIYCVSNPGEMLFSRGRFLRTDEGGYVFSDFLASNNLDFIHKLFPSFVKHSFSSFLSGFLWVGLILFFSLYYYRKYKQAQNVN